ncbi:hypothetical protein Tco_1457188, partial [Tanacetum coccineum]
AQYAVFNGSEYAVLIFLNEYAVLDKKVKYAVSNGSGYAVSGYRRGDVRTFQPYAAISVFNLRPNMAFDLRPTEDVLLWPGNANMAFDLRPTEDVLLWPGNANMTFDLRPTKDVLLWPGNANKEKDIDKIFLSN